MIVQYFDINYRQVIVAPGNLTPLGAQTWTYGDNYNLAIYLTSAGTIQPISAGDSIQILLYQPPTVPPANELAVVSSPIITTDGSGNQYYLVNVNLKTTQLASLVQGPYLPIKTNLRYIFSPADQERFSSSTDVSTTINPDPSQGISGATPIPPGYPSSPSVFELVANKGVAGGYAGLDGNANLNPNKIPTDTTMTVSGGKLSVVGGSGGGGNPYVTTIPASFTIPAPGSTIAVIMSGAVPDMMAGQGVLITEGTHTLNGLITSVSGTTLTVENISGSSGTMGTNSHVYLGNAAAIATNSVPGLVAALSGNANSYWNGIGSYTVPDYTQLQNRPSSFPPQSHAPQHLSTGNDVIPVVTPTLGGLCPPIDNNTIVISGGKLVAQLAGGGGTQWIGSITGTPAIPAAGVVSISYTLAAANADITVGMAVILTDGTKVMYGIVASYTAATPACTIRNTGAVGGAVTGNWGSVCHMYAGGSDLASSTAPGIIKPDGTTISIAAGVISTVGAPGIGNHGFRVRMTAANSLAAGGNALFDTVDWDTDTYHSGTTFSTLTIPAAQAGVYIIQGEVLWPNSSTGTYRSLTLTGVSGGNNILPLTNASATFRTQVVTIYKYVGGNTVGLQFGGDFTGSLSFTQAILAVQRIG